MDDRTKQFRRDAWRDLDTGWIVTVELLSAVGVWMGIGWLVDRWLATDPWFMLAGAVLGFVLGMYLAFLRAEEQSKAEEARFQRP
jgi:F0F1-type ATP synthase assembly protein I